MVGKVTQTKKISCRDLELTQALDTPNQAHKRNSLLEGFFAQEKPNYSYALRDDNHTNDVPKHYTGESPVTVLSTGLAGFHISSNEKH